VRSWTYDQADRVTNSGYSFDAFGRITQVPAADAGGSQMSLSYHANDRVRSRAASGNTDTITIDPLNRVQTMTTPSATHTWHFADDADSPVWVGESADASSWSRNITGPSGILAAVADQSGDVVLQLTNLHGDIIATASPSGSADALLSIGDQTEFGESRAPSTARYGWLGGYQRAVDPATGLLLMGARVYAPTVGRFLQVDPVPGGSANAYEYGWQDPCTRQDLSGYCSTWTGWMIWLQKRSNCTCWVTQFLATKKAIITWAFKYGSGYTQARVSTSAFWFWYVRTSWYGKWIAYFCGAWALSSWRITKPTSFLW
jgi:RHS repeat-associated protein